MSDIRKPVEILKALAATSQTQRWRAVYLAYAKLDPENVRWQMDGWQAEPMLRFSEEYWRSDWFPMRRLLNCVIIL